VQTLQHSSLATDPAGQQYVQLLLDAFNVTTNMFVMKYVFKRLAFLGNKMISLVLSMMFLAVWHGFAIGKCKQGKPYY